MTYLFLDTNIYLHFQDFEQLPWGKILSVTDELCVVIPPVILAEINKLKDQGTGKVNRRAEKINKKLGDILVEGNDSKIAISSCEDPEKKHYETYGLDRDVEDDRFILSALLFSNNGEKDVRVVTNDIGVLLKAKKQALPYFRMPNEYLLKEELSKEEKELAEAKNQLRQYTNRLSTPCLTFENGEIFIKTKKPVATDELIIQKTIREEKEKVVYFQTFNELSNSSNSPTVMPSSMSSLLKALPPSPAQIEQHNREVDEYHQEFEAYIRQKDSLAVLKAQIHELKFVLTNKGTAPTGDIEIFMCFPDSIRLYNRTSQKHSDTLDLPILPQHPSKLFSQRDMQKRTRAISVNNNLKMTAFGLIDNRPEIWDLSKIVKKHKYQFSEASVPQTLGCNINFEDDIYVDLMQCGSFSIDYTVVDTSLLERINGKLNFIVE